MFSDPFSVNRDATLLTGGPKFIVASRTLARCLLFRHLMQLDITVHVFEDLNDSSWLQHEATKKVVSKRSSSSGLLLMCGLAYVRHGE